jgi:AcrR family transcriptional regulator
MSERRDQILDAALDIADEEGLGAVTMRAVASRVGVTAMALYPHVSGKEDLLDGLVTRLLAGVALPDASLCWTDRLRELGCSGREALHRHPALVPLLFAKPGSTLAARQTADFIYQALLDAGVPAAQIPRLERLITTFLLGFVISETSGRFVAGTAGAQDWRTAAGRDTRLPAHRQLAAVLAEPSWDDEFAADLDDLIGMVAGRSAAENAAAENAAVSRG